MGKRLRVGGDVEQGSIIRTGKMSPLSCNQTP